MICFVGSKLWIVDWYDPPMCDRAVQIIPGLLNSMNRLEGDLPEKANEAKRNKKWLIISWFLFFFYVLLK